MCIPWCKINKKAQSTQIIDEACRSAEVDVNENWLMENWLECHTAFGTIPQRTWIGGK